MRVRVYFNLHKRLYSVMAWEGPSKGRVIEHIDAIGLTDAKFIVQPAGRQRVLDTRTKNVHAFVEGEYVPDPLTLHEVWVGSHGRLRYNPYESDSFLLDGEPVSEAGAVWGDVNFDGNPQMYAIKS